MRTQQDVVAVPFFLRFVRVLIALSAAWLSAGGALAEPTQVIAIAEARSLPIGTIVTVEGGVSTPSGAFASSFFDQGFGLQDATAGIYISLQDDLGLVPHRRVRVTGTLAESFGLRVIVPVQATDVKIGGLSIQPITRLVRTASISESTEGRLVTVVGVVTQAPKSDLPYGYKLQVDDGSGPVQIFINLETEIDVEALEEGEHVILTGFSSQFDDHYEIDPRSPTDVIVLPF